jgi:hypothetical protein
MQRAMKKELIICLVIIFSIVIGDIWLQNYTSKTLDTISTNLEALKETLDDNKYSREKVIQVNDEWDKRFNILTCFLEHDELEKVKTQLVVITAGIDVEDTEYVYEEINKAIYILDHIKDKNSLKLDNIF